MARGVGEPSKGLVTRPSISEKLWHSCTELANRALTDAFVSQLAAGTLQKISFQHYIAQDAFFLAAFDKAYERAQDHVEDVGAKESVQELRKSVSEELQLHEGYAKVGRRSPFLRTDALNGGSTSFSVYLLSNPGGLPKIGGYAMVARWYGFLPLCGLHHLAIL
jgi:thiaminase